MSSKIKLILKGLIYWIVISVLLFVPAIILGIAFYVHQFLGVLLILPYILLSLFLMGWTVEWVNAAPIIRSMR